MSQISFDDAADLLRKLLSERIPLQAFLIGPENTTVSFFGFADSLTDEQGLIVSASGPPIDVSRGYLRFAVNVDCTCWYGEKRELAEEILALTAGVRGDSALSFLRPNTRERLTLTFTV